MKQRLNVLVASPPAVTAPADLAACYGAADLIELRLDVLPLEVGIAAWIEASPRPVLATVRSRAEGGAFEGTPAEAAALLRAAIEAGAAWVDAEASVRPLLGDLPAALHVVASAHGTEAMPAEGDLQKVARPVDDADSWNALRAEARDAESARVFVPYGRLGAARAVFEPRLLYGAWDDDSAVVSGQPSLGVLLDELRAGEVTPEAALYGLIGEPPSRSPSPAMHNAVFRAWGWDALYVPLPGLDLESALALPFAGFSVTHPYKSAALEAAASLSEDARRSGAVNTLLRGADGWQGDNTDVAGLRSTLTTRIPPPEAGAAFVYGTGGFARAAAVALTDLGFDVRLGPRDSTYTRAPADTLLVNATPSGADGGPLPWLASSLEGLAVVDAPYAAAGGETTLVRRALSEGAADVFGGRSLLLAQARLQAERFGGGRAHPNETRIAAWALRPPQSLVLLGARGAGKTSVGRRVAAELGRPFVDLDDEVTRVTGRAPWDWIETDGWEPFRETEARLLERALARRGVVIATGGGVVEHEGARVLLRGHGLKVHLEIGPSVAAARVGEDAIRRPRWPRTTDAVHEAATLIARRTPAWRSLADVTIDAERRIDDVMRDVVRCWGDAKV